MNSVTTLAVNYMEAASNCDLPVDVIHEILLRLPVKALMRFKCVCKHWCALIECPTFVNQHFSHKSNRDCLLIRHYKLNETHRTYSLYADELGSGYEEPDHLQFPDGLVTLMGPLNGVLCVVGRSGRLALFNPAMRQFRPIPSHDLNGHSFVCDYVTGFGLDAFTGDYNVISARYFCDNDVLVNPRHVSIFNSGSDSWRHIENVDLVDKMLNARDKCSTCLGGVHYWSTWVEDNGAAFILALDCSANFQEIQVPECIKYIGDITLAIYGDSLALLSYGLHSTDPWINVWVMKEEGCWTKTFTLGPIEDLSWPICLWKGTELVLETGDATSLTLCDIITGRLRTIEARRKLYNELFDRVFCYKESLVSIKGEGGSCKLWDTSSHFVKDWFS